MSKPVQVYTACQVAIYLYWLKKFPTWKFLRNNFVPNWREVLTSIICFRPTWSKVKFLKSYTPKDNFIPIWDEVKILRFITFRQYVGKFFGKNQSPAYCRGLIRNLNLSFGATCTEVITEAILIPIPSKTHYVQLLLG